MAINFYRQQEESIRKAWFLLALFLVATFLLTVAITTLSALAIKLFLLVFLPNANFPNSLLWLIGFLCPVLVFSASVKKLKQLSKGNYSAIMAGGVLLKTTDNLQEQRLRNTVEEIAISANIPVPHIYILKMEPSVNAFAAGLRPTDMAIGITRGAFESLNRDELQGVIAYEMAQIINGHARLNTLVYGVLFGLDFIYIHLKKFFSIIFKPFSKEINRVHKKELDQHEATSFIVSFYSIVLGIFLFLPLSLMVVVSYIGHFFAQIIKSSICRQNVFQADATAVQLARNPNGIASVLQKSLQTKWSYILFADTFMQELSHLLFTFGSNPIYEFQILHTHPDTRQRIYKLLPHWNGELPQTQDDIVRVATFDKDDSNVYHAASAAFALGIIANISDESLLKKSTENLENEEYWFNAARLPEKAPAVVVAMLARHNADKKACLDIAQLFNKQLYENIKQLLEHTLPEKQRFAVLSVALPNVRLNIIGEENINKYKTFLQNIIKSDGKITLFEHCVYAAVSGSLKVSSLDTFLPSLTQEQLMEPMQRLLMLTARFANQGKNAEATFYAANEYCGLPIIAYQDNIPLGSLSSLLVRLDRLSPLHKQRLMDAIKQIIVADDDVSNEEHDWLSMMQIALGVACEIEEMNGEG